jgi:toxin ParE1/3/4
VKPAEFHPEAEAEYHEAIAFYDAEDPGLGDEFVEAVAVAVDFVRAHPEAGRPVRRTLRRWLVRRFPYFLIYRDEPERIYFTSLPSAINGGNQGTGGTGPDQQAARRR